MQTNLREAENLVRVEGFLSEKNLEIKNVNGVEVITGDLKLQTSETNTITFKVYIPKLKKDGTPNSLYEGMLTVKDTYKSIATHGMEEADRIRVIKGSMSPNTYYINGMENYNIQYRSSFFNRVMPGKEDKLKAQADIELYVKNIVHEVDKEGEETGRLIIKGLMPLVASDKNNVIEPVDLYVPESLAEDIESSDIVVAGNTVTFFVDIVNSVKIYTVEIPALIGKPRIETRTDRKDELVVTGIKTYYSPDDDNEKAYSKEIINAALTERDIRLAELKAKSMNPSNNATKTNTAKPTGRTLPFAGF